MHLPASALPGAATFLLDPAGQAVAAQVFGRRPAPYFQPLSFTEAFRAPAYVNGWVDYGGGFNPGGYLRDRDFVHLRGLIKNGTVGLVAFTLPLGYRPANREALVTISNGLLGRVDVLANGDVTVVAGSNLDFSLDGIVFRAA